ncbi:MAG: hypothetical protein WCY21_01715 [Candidatus Cloacimonadaceae bacterium]|jgi:hypothetical protein|nr:hypothetical protein [Candidatus Cloacimonadota bacterium]MDX9949911.1 hypothetical protein [Candidatus Syntrophosphaera sp.]NLN84621.1 hypothetical protein [Candidatus Cloacimonadota bacterium]
MSKDNRRGKGVKNLPNRGRGECPVCNRSGIKLLNEVKVGEQTVKVCKNCRHIAATRLGA